MWKLSTARKCLEQNASSTLIYSSQIYLPLELYVCEVEWSLNSQDGWWSFYTLLSFPGNKIEVNLRRFVFQIKPHLHVDVFFPKTSSRASSKKKGKYPLWQALSKQQKERSSNCLISRLSQLHNKFTRHTVAYLNLSSSLLFLLALKINLTSYNHSHSQE